MELPERMLVQSTRCQIATTSNSAIDGTRVAGRTAFNRFLSRSRDNRARVDAVPSSLLFVGATSRCGRSADLRNARLRGCHSCYSDRPAGLDGFGFISSVTFLRMMWVGRDSPPRVSRAPERLVHGIPSSRPSRERQDFSSGDSLRVFLMDPVQARGARKMRTT